MSDISISRQHQMGITKARSAVTKVAKAIAEDFDVKYQWNDDTLEFQRPGVHGDIEISADSVHVKVHLNFLLYAIKGRVRDEIEKQLEKNFGPEPG